MIDPRHREQERLAERAEVGRHAGQEHGPDRLGGGRAARLARRQRRQAASLQPFREQASLGRFADPVATLERNEAAGGRRPLHQFLAKVL